MSAIEAPEPDTPPALWLRLLGEPAWQAAEGPRVALAAKDAALLARLALEGPQSRGTLHALLWPDATPERAANSLRQRCSRLNRAAGGAMIELVESVRLGRDTVADASRPAVLETADLLAAGDLLAGVDFGDNGDLDAWLQETRARVRASVAEALADRAEALEREGRLFEALPLARRVAELLPLGEHGWRRLMRLHYLRGDRGAAQDAYWQLRNLLRDELGIQPSADTRQLMQTIETAQNAPAAARRAVPASLRRPPVLVGRDAAWQAMADAWQGGQCFLLLGDAGLGKSRLLEDFVAGREGVYFSRAQPGDEKAPYALLGRVLLALERQYTPALEPAVRHELARLRPEFGSAPRAPAQAPVLWHAMARLLAGARARGLQVLVLDDLHNADPASVEALRWLCASPETEGLRYGLASRPGFAPDSALAAWLQDSQRPLRVELAPLTAAELTQLLASLALPALLDQRLARQLHRHAGGHLLYTLATLHEMVTEAGAETTLPRPSSVEALLDARIAGLPEAVREVLSVAAVAGTDLGAERVAHLLGRSVLSLTDLWAQLEAADVLHGETFSHDLMHEAALRAVPRGIRQALHRQLAALLATEAPAAPAARVAWHWERGERWSEAGRWWHAAGEAARTAGRLAEQVELFENAARCHAAAGDDRARFDALYARLQALKLRHGGSAVLAALPELETLALQPEQHLRCRLARARAWLDLHRANEAVSEAAAAVEAAVSWPAGLPDATALQAEALAQAGRFDDALAAAHRSLQAAEAAGDDLQRLHALDAMRYVHYACGRIRPAVEWLQRMKAQAEAIGFEADVAAAEGNLAALLAVVGDVPASHDHAQRCERRHRDIGLAQDSTLGAVNHIVLGSAAAALGRFDEALRALQAAVVTAGSGAAPAARAKARMALAGTWLLLGRSERAAPLLEQLPDELAPGMKIQVELLRAQACQAAGASPRRHFDNMRRLAEADPDPPLVQSAWFEWSHQGPPGPAVRRLQAVAAECERQGLHGTARAMRWRELERRLEDPQDEGVLALAAALLPHAVAGTSAKCHPPQTLATLQRAFLRGGDAAAAAECRRLALDWIDAALARTPEEHRESFLQGNAVVAAWRAGVARPERA